MRVRMRWLATAAGLLLGLNGVASAQVVPAAEPPRGDTAPVDYLRAASWICRPGAGALGTADGTCSGDLDATAVTGTGVRTPLPFTSDPAPPIDCFYVYPTTSDDLTFYSDLAVDASEEKTVHAQAARLSARCRLFVPAYHQATLATLQWRLAHPQGDVIADINAVPYRDIRDAWRAYLAHDNHGRGVVLVGHSQGAILLKRLIAEEVDGKPAQRLLVAAYLAGNPNLGTKTFKAIPPCETKEQIGCIVAWSSFADGYDGERSFGGTSEGAPICVNPASPSGGRAMLKAILPRPGFAPASDPPYVETLGQLSAQCVTDANGAVLRVRVEPGRYADLLGAEFAARARWSTWGLHSLDVNLVQGDLMDMLASQSASWAKHMR